MSLRREDSVSGTTERKVSLTHVNACNAAANNALRAAREQICTRPGHYAQGSIPSKLNVGKKRFGVECARTDIGSMLASPPSDIETTHLHGVRVQVLRISFQNDELDSSWR